MVNMISGPGFCEKVDPNAILNSEVAIAANV